MQRLLPIDSLCNSKKDFEYILCPIIMYRLYCQTWEYLKLVYVLSDWFNSFNNYEFIDSANYLKEYILT